MRTNHANRRIHLQHKGGTAENEKVSETMLPPEELQGIALQIAALRQTAHEMNSLRLMAISKRQDVEALVAQLTRLAQRPTAELASEREERHALAVRVRQAMADTLAALDEGRAAVERCEKLCDAASAALATALGAPHGQPSPIADPSKEDAQTALRLRQFATLVTYTSEQRPTLERTKLALTVARDQLAARLADFQTNAEQS